MNIESHRHKLMELYKRPFVQQFRDVRMIGLTLFGIMALLVTWSGINVVQTNYELQKQIARLEQENEVQELANSNMRLRNQYLETDEFLELAARRQFGKGAPGEKLLLVPTEVALSNTVPSPGEEEQQEDSTLPQKPTYQKNFEAWMNFFLGRQTTDS